MLPVDQPTLMNIDCGAAQNDDLFSVFEPVIQFSVELSKLDLDVTETAMFAAATLVQPGLPVCFVSK